MALTKRRLKGLIEYSDSRNELGTYTEDDVVGVSTDKCIISTKANLDGVDLRKYKLFPPEHFAFVADTSRRGDRIALAYNDTDRTYIVSTWYVVFSVRDDAKDVIAPDYLFLYFNRPEFDRYARINSWGSAREYFWFADMEDIIMDIPSLPVQQKYISIYNTMLANRQNYARGLDDLKLACDGYIEDLRRRMPSMPIGAYIELNEAKNSELTFGLNAVRGVSIGKKFIRTKADMKGVDLSPYFIVKPGEFAYVPVTSRNGGKISIAINDSDDSYICSSSYVTFRSTDKNKLYPPYLMMFFLRDEFNRYARFNSWGSAREIFSWDDFIDIKIPIPDIRIQRAISEIFEVYIERKQINDQIKEQIKNICPILIKGSLEDQSDEFIY